MSIGAFQAGLESCARMLYVDTQAEQIFHYQDGQPTSQPFDLQPLQALPFLRLHGRQVDPVCMAQNRLTLDRTEESLARLILNRRPHSLPAVVRLRERVLKAPPIGEGGRGLPLSAQRACPWLCDALRQVGYASYDQDQLILDVGAVKFLDGGWLEAYTYLALRQSRALVDVVCRLKLSGVENELDVACTLNAKLGVIECKSGSLKGPTGQAALNRLRALRDSLGGVFGKAFLIIGQNSADLPEVFQRRAAEYVSRIIGLEDLHRVEDLVQEEMSRKRR